MFNITFKRLKSERKFNNYDVGKGIAFFTMIVDHLGFFLFPKLKVLRLIGRASAIIYAILFGINKKRNLDKLIIYAVIFTIFDAHLNRIFPLNTLYNFYLSSFILDKLYNIYNDNFKVFFVVMSALLLLGSIANKYIEYGTFFAALMFCGRIFRKEEKTLKDKIVTVFIFFAYFCFEAYHFKFGVTYSIILFLMFLAIYLSLFDFKFKEMGDFKFQTPFLLVSRYSTECYVIQNVILILSKYYELFLFL
ncbi:hypothetical protein FACS1894152_5530 [Bacilli bacterium]|nr:hypothetical protein FACS1894152_5530 [Bacilli bacterium]